MIARLFKNKTRPSVCFVTNELYPANKGGIGRMLYNFAQYNAQSRRPADIHFLVGGNLADDPTQLGEVTSALGQTATIHLCPDLSSSPDGLSALVHQAGEAARYDLDGQLALSYRYYRGLLQAQKALGRDFDIIEFPDFGGWSQTAIEAKRAGLAFADTLLSVRVHSTQSVIYMVEKYAHLGGSWLASQFDGERIGLTHADHVVGHIPAVVEYNLRHYDLDSHDGRVSIEFPPIVLDEEEKAETVAGPDRNEDFIFSSRLQQFKRPDIFIRAAVAFLETHPDYTGTFRLVSYGWDEDYIARLRDIVPRALTDRVLFILDTTAQERLGYIRRSIVVQPSDYESLCLFAYEASEMGRKLILNGACLAFGSFDRWRDGDNCLLFDGSVPSLVAAMERALDWQPGSRATITPDKPYWQQTPTLPAPPAAGADSGISLLCFGARNGSELRQQIANAAALVATEAAPGALDVHLLIASEVMDGAAQEIATAEARGWQVSRAPGHRFDPDTLTALIAGQSHDLLFLLPAGMQVPDGFFAAGAQGLRRNAALEALGGHLEIYDIRAGNPADIRMYGGAMPTVALASSRILSTACFLRKSLVERVGFDYRAGDLWFEAFARSAVLDGAELAILPMIAARTDLGRGLQQENSRRLTAGILDGLGQAAGLDARLLGLDTKQAHDLHRTKPVLLTVAELRGAMMINPATNPVKWNPVQYHTHLAGLLVHPLAGEITVAALPATIRNPHRLSAAISNKNIKNDGAEVALAFGPRATSREALMAAIAGEAQTEGLVVGGWQRLGPGEKIDDYMIATRDAVADHGMIFLMSRPLEGGSDANLHIAFSEVGLAGA